MPKRTFDAGVIGDIKASASNTISINYKSVEIDKINPNSHNFYSMTDIELLAEDIARQGLKHNLVVYEDGGGTYTLISGHRRFAAVSLLIEQEKWQSKFIPCYVSAAKSENEAKLDMITLNSTARILSDSELVQQYEMLDEIFTEDERLSREYGGRMREKIAARIKVSASQIGKVENIKHNAVPEVMEHVKNGGLSISTANEIAKLDENEQHDLLDNNDVSEITHKEVKAKRQAKKEKPKPATITDVDVSGNDDDTDVSENDDDTDVSENDNDTDVSENDDDDDDDNVQDDNDYDTIQNNEFQCVNTFTLSQIVDVRCAIDFAAERMDLPSGTTEILVEKIVALLKKE
ncbi:hypothetical protein FACS1894133_2520 [Clostridia bacterium]|nr:hypothetical protein FACS1894133_2520 [Clostridia bacterium]